jgi:hypothetical protein
VKPQTPASQDRAQVFPDYLGYQGERPIPVVKIILSLSLLYLVGFLIVDYFRHPELFKQILMLRALAAFPLLILLRMLYGQPNHQRLPWWFSEPGYGVVCVFPGLESVGA